jgi:hypothetical protein
MSDHELRRILKQTIEDIDAGRIRVRSPRRSILRHLLAPPLIAASLGLAAGCDTRSVGASDDGGTRPDAAVTQDGEVDSGPVDLYGVMTNDGGPFTVDAAYMAPFDSGPEPPYMAPFDGGVDSGDDGDAETDGGPIPLYQVPPPPDGSY